MYNLLFLNALKNSDVLKSLCHNLFETFLFKEVYTALSAKLLTSHSLKSSSEERVWSTKDLWKKNNLG